VSRPKISETFPDFILGVINSYTQIFFSDSRIFATILVIVSFFDFWSGFSGMLAVIISNFLAHLIGFNAFNIKKGYYGFNSLLVGLGLGVFYQPGVEFFLVLVAASLLTLFLTLWMEGVIGKYALPYLSLSFLLGTWLVSLATRQFSALQVSERGIFMINEMYDIGGHQMVEGYNLMNNLEIPYALRIYFKSLGAILFQYHLFAGILIAAGLLIHSRISFLLSLVGFFTAYGYYQFIGANMHELNYSYIGFNFILTSIAIGGFFVIPSRWSCLWVIVLTPLISIILTSTQTLFSIFQLSVYSLPFNIVVMLFLYALKFRVRFFDKPELVVFQQYSPEKNLYSSVNYKARFGKALYFPFILPFWGNWKVTQGHNGSFTHQSDWRHAWDFEVTDDNESTFSGSGQKREDYHAYGKPVVAPAAGVVEEIIDGIDENDIGKMDLQHNWGNTIILRHADQLYTKLSHLKKGSVKVKPGDFVKKGEILAHCGNTGRSPVPHIHFQVQTTPYIGSKTLEYPLSHYILHRNDIFELKSYSIPEEGATISNISKNSSLEKAFHFIPGQEFNLTVTTSPGDISELAWEVKLDSLNNTYIYCEKTKSMAWFRNDGDIHYFTHFDGDQNSLLFKFYLGAYKVMTGYYPNLRVADELPVNTFSNHLIRLVQDFFAPFFFFTRSEYVMNYLGMDDVLMQTNIRMQSTVLAKFGRRTIKTLTTSFLVGPEGIESIKFLENDQVTELTLKAHP
jgi:urea transporter/murein DD-endopeptidase MepM/ murein hydrolase activator NlpD